MAIKWIDQIGEFEVVRREIPRQNGAPYFLNSSTLIGVLHTTESATVNSAWNALNAAHSAPHFIVGEGQIVQCRPLNAQGAALRPGNDNSANVHAQIQVEMVGKSKEVLWLPGEKTLK